MEVFTGGGAMGRGKGLWCCWCLVLWLSLLLMEGVVSSRLANNKTCTPSRCDIITNISSPFRLQDDPSHCGRLVLACENNVTLLRLHDIDDYYEPYDLNNETELVVGTYRVVAINYDNFTIRLVDAGIQEGNCSSLPLSSLYPFRFHPLWYGEFGRNGYSITSEFQEELESIILNKQLGYLNCSHPVSGYDAEYMDTATCVNWDSKRGGHVYAVAGDLLAPQFQPQCRLILVTLIASDWESVVAGGRIKSYADIHKVLSYGFELSWLPQACADLDCPYPTRCTFRTQRLQCVPLWYCLSPLGLPSNCHLPEWRDAVEGLFHIVGQMTSYYSTQSHFSKSNVAIPLGIVTGRYVSPLYITARFLFGIILLIALLIYSFRRRHLSMYETIEDFIRLHNLLPLRYSYKDLKTITEGFKYKIGKGGFGTVYKGKLKSGIDVAVKMLGETNGNCQEFISEVATIGRIHHFNVVHLVGFCVDGTKRALIYEFMSKGSLDKYIFSKDSISLSYHKIYEISLGVARGIAYLHHGCDMQILHFDIKPHNILLDDNFTPKISDFGLARLYSIDDSIATLTAIRGTIGYMAPELFYNNIGRVSHRVDVYSFGMLLMEMASRRRNLNPHAEHSSQLYFPLWIYDQFDEEKGIEMEDLSEEECNIPNFGTKSLRFSVDQGDC